MFRDILLLGALLNKSMCKTGGEPPDEDTLDDMEERVIGMLGVETIAGLPGAYGIGAHPAGLEFLNIFSLCFYELPCPMTVRENHLCGATLWKTSRSVPSDWIFVNNSFYSQVRINDLFSLLSLFKWV